MAAEAGRRARRSAAALAVALTLPGCGTLIARGLGAPDAALRGPFAGVLVDLVGCCLILPLPLCLADLPLSLLAGIGLAIADAVQGGWPVSQEPPVVCPTPGAPRVRAVLDGFVPAAEVTSAVAVTGPLRLVAASPARGPVEAAALAGRGEALVAAGFDVEASHSVLLPRDRHTRGPRRWRVAPDAGRTSALALDEAADRGLVVDDRGQGWVVERSGSSGWTRRAALAQPPRGGVVALAPSGRWGAGASAAGVVVWDLGQPGPETLAARALAVDVGAVTGLAFDGDELLLLGTSGGDVLRVRLAAPEWLELLGREPGPIEALACRSGVVAWAGGGQVLVRRGLEAPRALGDARVAALAVDLEGEGLWLAGTDGVVRRLALADGRELDRLDLRGLGDAPLRVRPLLRREVVLLTREGALLGFARE